MCMQMSTAIIEKQIFFNIWKTVHDNNHENGVYTYVSSFPFVRGEVLPATCSPPHLFHPPLSLVLFFQSSSSPVFLTSLFTQSSHLSLDLHRLPLPCSRNSPALFGSLSSAILSACPAHCNLLLTSLSVKLICTTVSSLNYTILRLSASLLLLFFVPSCFRTLAAFVVVVQSVPMFTFRTGMPV